MFAEREQVNERRAKSVPSTKQKTANLTAKEGTFGPTLGILAHDPEIDLFIPWLAQCKRARNARDEPDRAKVYVLIELAAKL